MTFEELKQYAEEHRSEYEEKQKQKIQQWKWCSPVFDHYGYFCGYAV